MKKAFLLITALTLGTMASAQTRLNAPDSAVVELGVTTPQNTRFGVGVRPALNLYGNVTLTERIYSNQNGQLWGTLKVGNDYNDVTRLFADGRLDYTVKNVTVYGAVRQGFYQASNFGNYGTSVRIGTQLRF